MDKIAKKVITLFLAMIVVSAGIYYFWIPLNLAPGGTTGLTIIIQSIFPNIPVSLAIGFINIVLLLLGFILIGNDFGGYTVLSSIFMSLIIRVFETFLPSKGPIVDDPLLNLIYGGFCVGLGIGIVFNLNASTGGTDIVAKILNKYYNIPLSKAVLMADVVITIGATFVVGPKIGMYSILGIMVNTFIIDKVISGFNTKTQAMIISDKYEEINLYLNKEIGRGTTIFMAEGGFSTKQRRVINTVLSKNEYIKARTGIWKIDPKAFIITNNVNEVLGEGFTYEKLM